MDSDKPICAFSGPAGLRVEIRGSLLMLALVFLGYGLGSGLGLAAAAGPVLMLCVALYLHELGHAFGNRVQGIAVSHITLGGGGGQCLPQGIGTPRQQEFTLAMGPVVNLGLWAICGLAAPALSGVPALAAGLGAFAKANLFVALFNLLPVQGLDGGRLLHLWLLRLFPPQTALRLAGMAGLVVSVLWLPLMAGLFLGFGLVLFLIPSIAMHRAMIRPAAGVRQS